MPHTITTLFNCTKCKEDLTEVKTVYGLIICPKCGQQHIVQQNHITEHGKPVNTDVTISLQAFGRTSVGLRPLPKGWTGGIVSDAKRIPIRTGTYDKDGNFVGP